MFQMGHCQSADGCMQAEYLVFELDQVQRYHDHSLNHYCSTQIIDQIHHYHDHSLNHYRSAHILDQLLHQQMTSSLGKWRPDLCMPHM